MKKFYVWCPGYGHAEGDGRLIKAETAHVAVERWLDAEHETDPFDDLEEIALCARAPGGSVEHFRASVSRPVVFTVKADGTGS